EHAKVVAKLTELVGDDETGDAGAENENFGFCGTSRERWSLPSLAGHQVPGVHRGHHQRRAPNGAELFEKSAARQVCANGASGAIGARGAIAVVTHRTPTLLLP